MFQYIKIWVDKNGYARYGRNELLHRIITDAPKGKVVDHIDRNPKNNTKSNLRVTNCSVNAFNTKKQFTVGAYPCVTTGRWRAIVGLNMKHVFLGRFDTKEEALQAVLNYKKTLKI